MTTFPRITLFVAALMASGAAFAAAPAAPPAAAPAAAAAPKAAPVVVKDAGLAGSQAVKYDLYFDRYIVANSNGYISTVTGDGKLDQLKWLENGKNGAEIASPTALSIRDGLLYVADATKGVRVFDLITGKQTAKYDIPGAIALAGVAATTDRYIYVSDMGKTAADGAIYLITPAGKVSKIASGASIKRPAGVDLNVNRLDRVGGTSSLTFVTADASDMVTIDVTGKELLRADLKVGKLASVQWTDNGYSLVQSTDGNTWFVDAYNKATKIADGTTGGNGVAWDWVRNKVLVAQPSTGVVILPGPKVAGF